MNLKKIRPNYYFVLFIFIISGCCVLGRKELGVIQLNVEQKSFIPYKGKEALLFKNQKGEELKLSCEFYSNQVLKMNNTSKEACDYYSVEVIHLKFKSVKPGYIIAIYLESASYPQGPYTANLTISTSPLSNEYESRIFVFPAPIDNACDNQSTTFKCNESLKIIDKQLTDIFKIQAFYLSDENVDNFKWIYYSKSMGLVGLITFSGDEYLLVNNPFKK